MLQPMKKEFIDPISLQDAKERYLWYVVANSAIIDIENNTCLLMRRGAKEKEAAGKWAFPGGKFEHEMLATRENLRLPNALQILAAKEASEEVGLVIDIESSEVIANSAFVRADGIPVLCATIAALFTGGKIVLEEDSVDDYVWASEDDLIGNRYDCVGSVATEALKAIALFRRNS